jgi:hypothetical protein
MKTRSAALTKTKRSAAVVLAKSSTKGASKQPHATRAKPKASDGKCIEPETHAQPAAEPRRETKSAKTECILSGV